VQTVGRLDVVESSRTHGYRLDELRDEAVGEEGVLKPPDFDRVSELVRFARHATVDAMRDELGLGKQSVAPPTNFNAFSDTDLVNRFVGKERRPGPGGAGNPPHRSSGTVDADTGVP
jgi:hypothetical protein